MWRERLVHFFDEHKKPEWRYAHAYRIYHLARELDSEKLCDDDILFAASILHDIGAYPQYKEEGIDHAVTSTQFCKDFLKEIGFPGSKMDSVLNAIEMHMHYSKPGPGLEAILIRDADILDFIGTIGIARAFLKAQDDLRAGYQELSKLAEELPGKAVSEKGRALALERRQEILTFLDKLVHDSFGGKFL